MDQFDHDTGMGMLPEKDCIALHIGLTGMILSTSEVDGAVLYAVLVVCGASELVTVSVIRMYSLGCVPESVTVSL